MPINMYGEKRASKEAAMSRLEKTIESQVCKYAQTRGWATYKFTSPGRRSVPDRLFLHNRRAIFVEFKRHGKRPTPSQLREHEFIRWLGFEVVVIDSVGAGKQLVDERTTDVKFPTNGSDDANATT